MEIIRRHLIKQKIKLKYDREKNSVHSYEAPTGSENFQKMKNGQNNIKIERQINIDCMNILELFKKLKEIKSLYFNQSEISKAVYEVDIFLYKRLNKEKVFCEIIINKVLIVVDFITTFLMKNTRKIQKSQFCANLVEEIIELFSPIKKINVYSDSFNFVDSSMYTLKKLVSDFKKNNQISNKVCNLNNLFFDLTSDGNCKYLKMLGEDINVNNEINKLKSQELTFSKFIQNSKSKYNELKLNFYMTEKDNPKTFFENLIDFILKSADFYPCDHDWVKENLKPENQRELLKYYIREPKVKSLNLSVYFDFEKIIDEDLKKQLLTANGENTVSIFNFIERIFEDHLNKYTTNKPIFLFFNEFNIDFVNTNINCAYLSDSKNHAISSLTRFFLLNFIPDYLEVKIVEIMNKNNSNLQGSQALFKYNKSMLSLECFNILNKLKFTKFFCVNSNSQRRRLLEIFISFLENRKTYKNLQSSEFSIFDSDVKFLQVNLDLLNKKKYSNTNADETAGSDKLLKDINNLNISNDINKENTNAEKWEKPKIKFIFNLKESFESILIRKAKSENIYKLITEKPTDGSEKCENIIYLKPFDLTTIADILSKIQGNKVFYLKDGRKLSVGGKFHLTIYGNTFAIILNTIIEIAADYSKLRIFTFNENYFLPMLNFAGEKFDFLSLFNSQNDPKPLIDFVNEIGQNESKCKKLNKDLKSQIFALFKLVIADKNVLYKEEKTLTELIFTSGGMTQQDLLSNFYFTPIYLINSENFDIVKIEPDKSILQNYPGVLFNHEMKIDFGNNTLYIKAFQGFRIENFTGGLKIAQSNNIII